ncbi:hypothetical protein J2S43_004259 [Catenuloplanes nepalensis]|uniref:Restriction endonuclease type IV Mrr domain-containing protein n=1 Tax=Catenuloplanes nepalensis TaxID=587533 RepID=A0ABT9MWC2_9ACTN|nr:hypothetical protein [Catenuloplanes nepalensis]MDP9795747.1 hypothetical protein [Catenuloplanes nepalensis]
MAFGLDDDDRQPLLAIGEIKWGERMGLAHLDRLHRIRALLTAQNRFGADRARLACFSGAGFDDDLIEAARQNENIVLITAADLYRP